MSAQNVLPLKVLSKVRCAAEVFKGVTSACTYAVIMQQNLIYAYVAPGFGRGQSWWRC